jgi:HK97 gp10 family phage protein
VAGEVSVTGATEAAAAYRGIAADARNMTEPNKRIAAAGEDAARARAPVRTGRLAGSIAGTATERDATLTIGVPYWPFQEFGTRYIQGQRFGRAGMDAMAAAAPDAYRERMAAIVASRS